MVNSTTVIRLIRPEQDTRTSCVTKMHNRYGSGVMPYDTKPCQDVVESNLISLVHHLAKVLWTQYTEIIQYTAK